MHLALRAAVNLGVPIAILTVLFGLLEAALLVYSGSGVVSVPWALQLGAVGLTGVAYFILEPVLEPLDRGVVQAGRPLAHRSGRLLRAFLLVAIGLGIALGGVIAGLVHGHAA